MVELITTGSVRVRAPGKINVYLGVGEAFPDGYHEIATAYQAVSLYEEVTATPARGFSVAFSGPIDSRALPVDASNLAIKAARALAKRAGYHAGVHLDIVKRVPIAGGMGGGSADAAGALVACDALWQTAASREELHEIAAELGADVPFALAGGTAIGTGRGDELSPALAQGSFQWVLVLPDIPLATPEVYAALDAHRLRYRADIAPARKRPAVSLEVLHALRSGDAELLAESLANDLQAAAIQLAPQLAEVLEFGERSGALAGIVSGSGPTVAFLTSDGDAALELQVTLSAAGYNAVKATGPVHGPRAQL